MFSSHAGNSWGVDETTGRGCVGCGPQEQFRGCADVAIGDQFTADDLIPDRKHTFAGPTSKSNQSPAWDKNSIGVGTSTKTVKEESKNDLWTQRKRRKHFGGHKPKNEKEALILLETLFQNASPEVMSDCVLTALSTAYVLMLTFNQPIL